MLLKEELEELQPAVVEMKEEALVKQSAKRKVGSLISRCSTI